VSLDASEYDRKRSHTRSQGEPADLHGIGAIERSTRTGKKVDIGEAREPVAPGELEHGHAAADTETRATSAFVEPEAMSRDATVAPRPGAALFGLLAWVQRMRARGSRRIDAIGAFRIDRGQELFLGVAGFSSP
jgi:hypothetical protein